MLSRGLFNNFFRGLGFRGDVLSSREAVGCSLSSAKGGTGDFGRTASWLPELGAAILAAGAEERAAPNAPLKDPSDSPPVFAPDFAARGLFNVMDPSGATVSATVRVPLGLFSFNVLGLGFGSVESELRGSRSDSSNLGLFRPWRQRLNASLRLKGPLGRLPTREECPDTRP